MGTVLEITICDYSLTHGRQMVDALFAAAARLDSLFTTFAPDSPLSRLNAQAGREASRVPPDVAAIVSLSLHYWQLTHGTFDVTVGPLVQLWRQAAARHTRPSPTVVQHVRARVGSEHIRLWPDGRLVLTRPGMAIDLGGIGKGFALDRLANLLKAHPASHTLLDFGRSSMWALGAPPDADGWRILVQHPNGRIVGLITLRDQALSVSGSLAQSFEIEGQRYGHVIDPRTGEPLQRDLLACVIAPSATQAEALSKAVLILGAPEGLALLEQFPGVAGMLVEASGQRWESPGWTQTVAFTPL